MKIKQVNLRRKFNLGNYETLDIEFFADVTEGEDFRDVAECLDEETECFMRAREERKLREEESE